MSWAGTGEAYDASYAALCEATADAVATAFGAPARRSLLDVGMGTGRFAVQLAAAGWAVSGCEPEASMRAVAQRQHPSLAVFDGALPELPFGTDSFDAVTANFVLNHVDDPRRSAAELARVARVRLAATIWLRSPSWLWVQAIERAQVSPPPAQRLAADKEFERTAAGFEGMLVDAGWRSVRVQEVSWLWRVAPEVLWGSVLGGVAGAGAAYRALDDNDRAAFERAFRSVAAEHADRSGALILEHTALLAVGTP